jgi:hypothetical protein
LLDNINHPEEREKETHKYNFKTVMKMFCKLMKVMMQKIK